MVTFVILAGAVDQFGVGVTPDVLLLVQQGKKIMAIKRYRELNPGIGLKEAKDVIDGLGAGSAGSAGFLGA